MASDDTAGRHEGHHHPADLSEAQDDAADAAAAQYSEAGYALEHCQCSLVEGPHRTEDHPQPTA